MTPKEVTPAWRPSVSIQGVVFDLDGTLTQPGAIDFARMRERIGMKKPGSILHWIDEHAGGHDEAEAMRAVVWEEEALALDRMALADHFEELIETLMRRGESLRTAICTRNSAEAIERFDGLLRGGGMPPAGELFEVLIARDHHSEGLGRALLNKPSPEPAHEAVRVWGMGERFPLLEVHEREAARYPELLFVGDAYDDYLSGRRAGFDAVVLDHDGQWKEQGTVAVSESLLGVARGLASTA